MFDIYCYQSLSDYMGRYKGLTDDPSRHIPVDAFYVSSDKIIMTLLTDNIHAPRPKLDLSVVIVATQDVSKKFDTSKYYKVTYKDTYYIPKSSKIGFIRYGILKNKYRHKLLCNRFLGVKPDKTTNICFNWFYDSTSKRLNLIISE